jgi:hypothetical protein
MSNEKRMRCGAVKFVGSSKTGIGAGGIGPPGVAGVGVTEIPGSPVNVPLGVGTLMVSALNELMLKPSKISQKAFETRPFW